MVSFWLYFVVIFICCVIVGTSAYFIGHDNGWKTAKRVTNMKDFAHGQDTGFREAVNRLQEALNEVKRRHNQGSGNYIET